MRRLPVLALCALLLVTAGVPVTGSVAADDADTDSPLSGLTYFPISDPQPTPPLSVGFSTRANASVFLVAENASGAVLGHTDRLDLRRGSAVDGLDVPTRANVTGVHRVRVVAYNDSNANGAFDASDAALNASTDRRWVLFTQETTADSLAVTPDPAVAATPTMLHLALGVERSVSLRRVAVYTDYRAGLDGLAARNVTVSAGSTTVTASTVSMRQGVLVATLPRTLDVTARESVTATLDGVRVPDPGREGGVTLVLNPESAALAGTSTFDIVKETTPTSADGGHEPFWLLFIAPALFAVAVSVVVVALVRVRRD
ncbi:hypothetical protein [Halarchaeum sp. P4]|uniref:hypothetical protein n=1 Tax=Halarchaeum sp. P4 TaxID=3421639 RepID=UPI003EBCEA9E